MTSHPRQRITSRDGRSRLEIVAEQNGMFRFVEETEREGDEYTGSYFAPSHWSGLYASAEDAERDARLTLPWLRDEAGASRG
jgi:hypothetical protein